MAATHCEQRINGKCVEAEQSKNSVKLFRIINEICGKISPKLINIQDKSGKLLDNEADIARRWKEHFEELYNIQNPVDKSVLAQLPSTTADEMDNFTREEVVHQIRKSQLGDVRAKFSQNWLKTVTLGLRAWTHTRTDRDDTDDLIICSMLCYIAMGQIVTEP